MSRTSLALAAMLTAFGGADLAGQALTEVQRRQVDSVFAPFDGTNRPGCSLAVGRFGTPVYLRGYGMSDLQHNLAITPESIFHVASVSKQFTAFAVGLLAEDGKLSLDDDVHRYIPELPDYGKRITLRHLIYHTSGIRDQWELLGLAGWRYPDDLFTQQDVLDIVTRQQRLNFDPGDQYLYSNSGYSLLAMIVERVSGQSLRQFAEERMFRPLGMSRTEVHDDHARIVVDRTSAYERGEGGAWKISIPDFDTHGATSLFTTAADLIKWMHNYDVGTIGKAGLIRDAQTSARLNHGKDIGYGFGLSIERYRGVRAIGHGGADAGYRADVVRFPEQGLEVAALCNFAEATPNRYTRAVADIVLGNKLGPREEAAPVPSGITLSDAQLDLLTGVYRSPGIDQAWLLERKDGKLRLANFDLVLEPIDARRFTAGGIVVEFAGPAGEPATGAKLRFGSQVFDSMARVPRFAPSPDELAAFAGAYWSDELEIWYRVERSDSGLVLRRPKFPARRMRPAFTDAFLAAGTGTLRFTRTDGRIDGFLVTGGRVRGVAFRRGPETGASR